MSASRLPMICACALMGCVVKVITKAMNNDSNWYLPVACSFIVSPFSISYNTSCSARRRRLLLASCRARREILEHLRRALFQILFILLGFVGQHVLGTAPPDQLLGFCVEQVDDQGSIFVVLFGCVGLAEAAAPESSPAPSPAEVAIVVIERAKRSLSLCCLDRYHGHIATAVDLTPALGRQLGIDRVLNSPSQREFAGLITCHKYVLY